MKTIISEKTCCELQAAEHIKSLIGEKPDAVIALAGGAGTAGLYECLLDLYRRGEISFRKVRALLLADFIGVPHEKSCAAAVFDSFLFNTDILNENCFSPDENDPAAYDRLIESLGGLDLAVLGLGENAHIGYNEPATPFASLTHVQKLTDATKRQNASLFAGADKLPELAVTMGIKTITDARDILVLAFGERKAEAAHKMLYGRNDSVVPAAFLQIPMNVTVYLDEAASSQL